MGVLLRLGLQCFRIKSLRLVVSGVRFDALMSEIQKKKKCRLGGFGPKRNWLRRAFGLKLQSQVSNQPHTR